MQVCLTKIDFNIKFGSNGWLEQQNYTLHHDATTDNAYIIYLQYLNILEVTPVPVPVLMYGVK